MKAIGYIESLPIAHERSLFELELPRPTCGPRDLLVRIEAVSVNPLDAVERKRRAGAPGQPLVLGWDAAGVVEEVGAEVRQFRPGDAVYYSGALNRLGSNAEYGVVDERIAALKPRSLSFLQAAALPLTAITAWEALFDRLGISPKGDHAGRSVLIIGGAGGVGSIGIQLAKVLAGLTVIATASRPESQEWCRRLGADHTVDHRGDLPAQLKALGFAEVDYILCFNDIDGHFPAMAELVAPQGKICTIVANTRPLPVELLKNKSATFVWEFMFTRAMYSTPDMVAQHRLLNEVTRLVDAGRLQTTLGENLGRINAENLRRAHAMLEGGRTIGKLVLEGF